MKIYQPTPELPVRDVKAAQADYHDRLGFTVGWYHADARMGAVSHGECAIFFRETTDAIQPVRLWIFTGCVDYTHRELRKRGANIIGPLADTSWGLRQFTVADQAGHKLNFFHDL